MHRTALVVALVLTGVLAGCAGDDGDLGLLNVRVTASVWGKGGEGQIRCPDSRTRLAAGVTCGFIDEHRDVIVFGPARPLAACRAAPGAVYVTGTWRGRPVHRELVGCVPGQGGAAAQLLTTVALRSGAAEYPKAYVRCESAIPGAGWDAQLERSECASRVLWRLDPRRRIPRTVAGCVKAWNRYAHTNRRAAAEELLPRGLDRVHVSLVPGRGRPTSCLVRFAGGSESFTFRARWLARALRWRGGGKPGPRARFAANVRVNENADLWLPR